ncbi:tripartite motif-containing protein 43-like [Macrotis lagotis]|uniref:tripartite motif-containing protein 43-like n=1 Tax=Macrotis lagotis TaxID=92651 RepID=UPI003D698C39
MTAAIEMLQKLQKEITCGICRNYFSQPVTIKCGHSFCQACLSMCWRSEALAFSCPECRQVSLDGEIPAVNEQLAQLTALGQQLIHQLLQRTEVQNHCATHNQVFKLFCGDDQTPLCVRCCQSPEHGAHMLSPIDEAAQNFREKLQNIQSQLGKGLEEIEKLIAEEKRPVVTWNWMISEEYNKLHQFLMEEETRCLERIKEVKKASKDRLSRYRQSLQDLMLELEEAGHQPNVELLQDLKELLGKTSSVLPQMAKAVVPELGDYPIPGMIEMLRRFQVDISMNPASASPYVTVYEDLKSVKAADDWPMDTKNPDTSVCHGILAEQTFSTGRQYWEVDVTQLPQWVLGIYTCYLGKKRPREADSYDSVFLLRCVKNKEDYCFQSYPGSLNHYVKGPVPRVGVYLEYSSGTLVFYNVHHSSLIYKFQSIPFTAPVIPIFSPGPPLLGIKPGPMILCPVISHLYTCCYSSH